MCFPISSPFPEERDSGTEDRDPVLDRGNRAGGDNDCDVENTIEEI